MHYVLHLRHVSLKSNGYVNTGSLYCNADPRALESATVGQGNIKFVGYVHLLINKKIRLSNNNIILFNKQSLVSVGSTGHWSYSSFRNLAITDII